jgi:hypothetical protein
MALRSPCWAKAVSLSKVIDFRKHGSTDLSTRSAEEIGAAAAALNVRPRKTLDWKTPAEFGTPAAAFLFHRAHVKWADMAINRATRVL